MSLPYSVPSYYEHAIGYGGVDSVSTAPSILDLTTRNINPVDLLSFTRKHGEAVIPEGDGARYVSDGKVGPDTVSFYGAMEGADPDDTFNYMAQRLNNLAMSTQQSYIKTQLYDGSVKQAFRRYGIVMSARASYAPKTRYEAISQFEMDFRILDPWWYFDSVRQVTVSCTGTSTTQASSDTGLTNIRTKRMYTTILRTGSGVPTNPVVKNNSNQQFQMTGTLATAGDYWKIDHMTGAVTKTVSGVTTDDIANFAGQFWGLKCGADAVTVTNGVSATFSVICTYLERRM